ncbi:MAG: hypothetical protein ACKVTZ_01570 [Bacteroidia bacterium]
MKNLILLMLLPCCFIFACSNTENEGETTTNDSTTQTQAGQAKAKEPKLTQADIEKKVVQVIGLWKLQEVEGETAEWVFEENSFVHKGKNASYDYEEKGVYHISRISGDTVLLYLDDIEGTFGNDSRIISMVLSGNGEVVSLNNQKYKKVK